MPFFVGSWADRKMKFALLCMGALITLFFVISFVSLRQIVSSKDDAAFYYAKRLTEADDLRTVFQETVASFRGWMLLEHDDLKTHFIDRRNSLRRRLGDLREHSRTASEEERVLLDQVFHITEEIGPRTDAFLRLPTGVPLWQSTREEYLKEIMPRAAELDGALRSYIWLVRGQLEHARAEYRKSVLEAFLLVGVTGLLSLGAIFALLYFISGVYKRLAATELVEKQARATSELAERRYRDLVKELDGGIVWEADCITFRPIYVSPSAKKATGIPIPEWLKEGRFWEDHIPWVDQEKFFTFLRSRVESAVRGGQPAAGAQEEERCEHRFLNKEGKLMWLQTGVHVFRESEKGPILLRALSVDVTAMKRAHEALRRSEQFNKGIVESSHDCIFVLDPEGKIVFVNNPSRSLLEVSDFGAMMQTPWVELWPTSEAEKVRAGLEKAGRGESDRFQVFRVRDSGQARYWDVVVTPMPEESGKVERILVVARDVTERRLVENRLAETAEKLSRSNRDLGDFACVASHDLQEPLRAVVNYLGLLKRQFGPKLEPGMTEYLELALEGTSRMRQFIEGLLSYSQVSTPGENIDSVPLDPVVDRVLQTLKLSLSETGAKVRRAHLPTVPADAMQIEQLLQNLLANSLKFRGDRKPELSLDCKDGGNEWVFSVQDNGIGFKAEEAGDIFEAFKRLHGRDRYAGCGLGLAVCKRIVERHRGKIWVDWSKPGEGTRICFTLPKLWPVAMPHTVEKFQAQA